jgi:hypothetical protein
MSHSTHVGFNAPFISSGETIVFSFARAPLPPHLQRAAPPVSVTAVGVGHIFRCAAHFCMEGASMFALAVCVGNNPNPIPSVRGADGGSWHTVPDRIIPERGQVSANGSHPETKQAWDVLHDDEARS